MRAIFRNSILVLLALSASLGAADATDRREQGQLVFDGIPPASRAVQDSLRQYLNVRQARVADWLADGSLLVSTRFGDTDQLHVVKQALGARRQLTFFDEPVSAAVAAPVPGGAIAFLRDVVGNEDYQIFLLDVGTGRYQMVTDGESRHVNPVWSRDGRHLAYSSNARDGRSWDVYVLDVESGESRRVMEATPETGYLATLDWSPDGASLLVRDYRSINDGRIYILDWDTGRSLEIEATRPVGGMFSGAFGIDGKHVYYVSERAAGFRELRRYDIADDTWEGVSEPVAWDVGAIEMSLDGRLIVWSVNQGGVSSLYFRELPDGPTRPIDGLPVGKLTGLSFEPGSHRLAVSLNAATAPGDVYVLDPVKGRPRPWVVSEVGGLDPDRFVEPSLVTFAAADTHSEAPDRIPAFLYLPPGEGPFPVIVYIHGGPESQYRPRFSAIFQYLISEMGFAVLAPNVRGSSGYGREYVMMDDGYRREDSVSDIGALLDWIPTRADLDEQQIVLFGGSYGGYMVLASMVHFGDRVLGGMESVGISNFVTFLENTRDYRRDQRRREYGDERDPAMREFLEKISPTNNAEKIRKPLLIVQGLNDPRVPASESEQMVATIRANEGQVWYLLGKNEGHGFRKKRNRQAYYEVVVTFLEHLLGRP
ncbi:MAG: S9 family peptidase [Gammaproteobacteria bacterium]|nr:MAG: S9 family peptidase [Gammaproteobacteria bacterium]